MTTIRAVILGAGATSKDQCPSALFPVSNSLLTLDWQLKALEPYSSDVLFVGGFADNQIRKSYPQLEVLSNPAWASQLSTGSLLYVINKLDGGTILTYSDIVTRQSVYQRLLEDQTSLAFGFDPSIVHEPGKNRESVYMLNSKPVLFTSQPLPFFSPSFFVGPCFLPAHVVEFLQKLSPSDIKSLSSMHISGLFEFLRLAGFDSQPVDISSEYVEVSEPCDLSYFILGSKAETLHRLESSLSLACIPRSFFFTVSEWENDSESIFSLIINFFKNSFLSSQLIVRSSSHNEDTAITSSAGKYTSVANVTLDNLKNAIAEVIDSYGSQRSPSDQVLVQEMVADVASSGVIFTRTLSRRAPWITINYTEHSDTSLITSGVESNHKTQYIHRSMLDASDDPTLNQLLQVINEIEHLTCSDQLDIEYAINQIGQVFLLQVRPLSTTAVTQEFPDHVYSHALSILDSQWETLLANTHSLLRNSHPYYSVMTDWNPAEIIGINPGRLASSLYSYLICDTVWADARQSVGYADLRPYPLIHNFAAKPYVDVRASLASFIPANISPSAHSRLLNHFLAKLHQNPALHDKVEFNIIPTCVTLRWDSVVKELANVLSPDELEQYRKGLCTVTENIICSFESDVEIYLQLESKLSSLSDSNVSSFHIKELIHLLRKYGTLPFAKVARAAFVSASLLREAVLQDLLSSIDYNQLVSSVSTVSHSISSDIQQYSQGSLDLSTLIDRYGHLRPGTYDISSPRYDSDPAFFFRCAPSDNPNEEPSITPDASILTPLVESLSLHGLKLHPEELLDFFVNSTKSREESKFIFTKALSRLLELIYSWLNTSFSFTREECSSVDINFLLSLFEGPTNLPSVRDQLHQHILSNRQLTEVSSDIPMPAIFNSPSPYKCFLQEEPIPNYFGTSTVTSRCVHVSESIYQIDTSLLPGAIICIKNADPGFDWIFSHNIAGLITEYGGANSHMSIRATEYKIPAAIGVGSRLYNLALKSSKISLNPQQRQLIFL